MAKEILIVDDDPDFTETMEIMLRAHGYSTRIASSGKEAIGEVKRKHPDIILLDIMMETKGDGIWASEKIKADVSLKHIPIIMITAVSKDAQMSRMDLGAEKNAEYVPVEVFMDKPVESKELLDEIKRLIGGPE
ncbi:response regulator [Candidatus Fermentibacterales bacterium]|nr:response regulator [Candidatus Fermentibacterales bacterium]